MKTVLVLGGYGGFGARLSKRLAADGWLVLVAGRNEAAARRFADTLPNARPVVADRNGDLAPILERHRPMLVIDAAGPFQNSDYRVADTCIACGVHYIDLADARSFVGGIAGLDDKAKAAGIVVVSGASSVPAMSGAVIAELSRDMDEVCAVSMAISASNRATAGASVAAAILSYVGKPVRLWRGKRWRQETGWHAVKRARYKVDGRPGISRLVALSDVPDHDIVPACVRGRPATVFRAGPEFSFQLLTLWLLSWPVKWGWVRSLSPLARWLRPLQRFSANLGTDRSAMMIDVKGRLADGFVGRRWTLIAEEGHGPEIPTMAAQLLAGALAEGRVSAGARSAAGKLSLGDFQPLLDALSTHRQVDTQHYQPLYRRVMGQAYETLPQPMRDMHDVYGDAGAKGRATVTRGRSRLACLIADIMRFPPAGEHDLHVSFEEEGGVERWTRDFDGRVFVSELSQSGRHLVERFGPMRFYFDLPSDENGLTMIMKKWSVFRLPMPLFLAPKSVAREWGEGEDFFFDVPVALPLVGDLVHYRGRLRRL
ncbi:NAD(P)-dependent dehydrogenase (short-subunit alcohol dehydrogenase family) [Neorhizobium huautlense]|uniref:NAD(P)-dependent dehydrogenase (Short-subunit alcohol dehydrogenase family) n=1 Tax=Neorhizobium huautlense TaxID=67774 RepID=A0ABT9PYN8_9HYPH|nr:SDR family oxidoreductase [Neorhizobium huautlense]MDP9839606.1 NAD(P)-dependent dehydrogenase (short-subunit alcohol dehydrogenase family) [Neorhizobium huautlense]